MKYPNIYKGGNPCLVTMATSLGFMLDDVRFRYMDGRAEVRIAFMEPDNKGCSPNYFLQPANLVHQLVYTKPDEVIAYGLNGLVRDVLRARHPTFVSAVTKFGPTYRAIVQEIVFGGSERHFRGLTQEHYEQLKVMADARSRISSKVPPSDTPKKIREFWDVGLEALDHLVSRAEALYADRQVLPEVLRHVQSGVLDQSYKEMIKGKTL